MNQIDKTIGKLIKREKGTKLIELKMKKRISKQ
jgi:hypothetical protein